MLCDWNIKLLVRVCAVLMHCLCKCARTLPKQTAQIPRSANASPSARMPVVVRGLRCTSTRERATASVCLHVVGASPLAVGSVANCRTAGRARGCGHAPTSMLDVCRCRYVSLSRKLLATSLSIIVFDWYCGLRMAALSSVQRGAEGEYHTRSLSYMHNSTAHATRASCLESLQHRPPTCGQN